MLRKVAIWAFVISAVLAAKVAFAGAYEDLLKVQAAFQAAKSWHAEEHFSNGKTTIVEYSAPDRWRVQPSPEITELVIGNDVYMVRNGRTTKLPFGGGMIRRMIERVGFSLKEEVRQSARDAGMQTLNGQSVHVYSYTMQGTPVTLYVNAQGLPVQSVVKDKKVTTTVEYSKYNAPITIEAQ